MTPAQERVADVALAVVVGGSVIVDGLLGPAPGLGLLDYALVVLTTAALALRRRWPRAVLGVIAVCLLIYLVRVQPGPTAILPLLIALYTTVKAGHAAVAVGIVAPLIVGSIVGQFAKADGKSARDTLAAAILPVGWFVAAAVTGKMARIRQIQVGEAEERAAEAERTREEMALRRAGEERLRIARELHDSLTHTISIVKVQAGVAVHLARKRGEQVPEALLAIQEAGGEAMRELRATLEVLRDPAEESSGLDRLEELARRTRGAGLATSLTVTGDRRDLPGEVDRASYRIVQEALTNVARHAGAASVWVKVDYLPGLLAIQVDDDGKARPDAPPEPGVGLRGMRERVVALGGRLLTEPRPEGGFTVRAELPAEEAATDGSAPGAPPTDGARLPANGREGA
ncbi:sensor histidine kinase [Streptosporangiaceae bacterium NEAU-GS5]|nr:sensor histidine kinase [Streptosporangiaceae bacterium NEAU-GS5]